MRARQREFRLAVIKGRTGPGGRRVANRARCRETCRHMIGVGSSGEILLVAGIAIRGRAHENVVDVALSAGHRLVRARQRERRLIVIENSTIPISGVVAYGTVGREIRRSVIRIGGPVKVFLVARVALGGNRLVVAVDMALHAGYRGMRPGQGEHRRVIEGRRFPCRRGVAESAIRRETG